jgi:hypothetical protein
VNRQQPERGRRAAIDLDDPSVDLVGTVGFGMAGSEGSASP